LAALVSATISLAGCSAGSSEAPAASSAHTLSGQLVVADLPIATKACAPTRSFVDAVSYLQSGQQLPCPAALPAPYAGARPGAVVEVTTASGRVLASSRLGDGVLGVHGVRYPFTVAGVPTQSAYVVKVSSVATKTYTSATLDRDAWTIEVTVGNRAL
jgi:hypothetical protein